MTRSVITAYEREVDRLERVVARRQVKLDRSKHDEDRERARRGVADADRKLLAARERLTRMRGMR